MLIPTPLEDELPLELTALTRLKQANRDRSLFVVEEPKVARRRWLSWGLPREDIEKFIIYNEHENPSSSLLSELKKGKDVYLMSDCGLPAFCDPGRELVNLCHQEKIKVTATPFPNSIALALALSGLDHQQFFFQGFLSRDKEKRKKEWSEILKRKVVSLVMDTPYRLSKTLEELSQQSPNKEIFLACDLNSNQEWCQRGKVQNLMQEVKGKKKRFILVVSPI